MNLFGVLCRLFDSHCPHGFCVGSLGSQMLLVVSHPREVESHYPHGFFVGTLVCATPVTRVTSGHLPFVSHWLQLAGQEWFFSVANAVVLWSHGDPLLFF